MSVPDYAFYTDSYRGTQLNREKFQRLVQRASERLAADTLGRSGQALGPAVQEKVQLCLCAMAEVLEQAEAGDDRLTGESLGSWKRSYAAPAGGGADAVGRAERLYLADTGLLYRGVRP